jgi:hypothetical protein
VLLQEPIGRNVCDESQPNEVKASAETEENATALLSALSQTDQMLLIKGLTSSDNEVNIS